MASAPTGLSSPAAADPLRRMHVTRPKSAKGRSRTTPQGSAHNMEAYACRASPTPRVSSARPPSAPRIAQDDVPGGRHQLPHRPPSSSLNRYRVLPSIGAAGDGGHDAEDALVHRTSSMRLDGANHHKTLYREPPQHSGDREPPLHSGDREPPLHSGDREPPLHSGDREPPLHSGDREPPLHSGDREPPLHSGDREPPLHSGDREPPLHSGDREPPQHSGDREPPQHSRDGEDSEPRLLLAIRSHSGQRFERYFRPSDTLYAILAAVEEMTGTSCQDCSVEAMEVPRRSFSDHSRTLQECRIPNKSVLCIQRLGRD